MNADVHARRASFMLLRARFGRSGVPPAHANELAESSIATSPALQLAKDVLLCLRQVAWHQNHVLLFRWRDKCTLACDEIGCGNKVQPKTHSEISFKITTSAYFYYLSNSVEKKPYYRMKNPARISFPSDGSSEGTSEVYFPGGRHPRTPHTNDCVGVPGVARPGRRTKTMGRVFPRGLPPPGPLQPKGRITLF